PEHLRIAEPLRDLVEQVDLRDRPVEVENERRPSPRHAFVTLASHTRAPVAATLASGEEAGNTLCAREEEATRQTRAQEQARTPEPASSPPAGSSRPSRASRARRARSRRLRAARAPRGLRSRQPPPPAPPPVSARASPPRRAARGGTQTAPGPRTPRPPPAET